MNYDNMNVRHVVNASGRMSILGVSTLSDRVIEAMKTGGERYYIMDELHEESGKIVANMLGTEAALITNSASSAITLSVAGCIAKDDEFIRRHLHESTLDINREVVLMKGHNVNYGAPVDVIVQLGGGRVREAGYANGCSAADLDVAITDETVAFLYIQSHHTVQKNMPTLAEVRDLCRKRGVPLMIDAAAEEDIDAYAELGDLVIFSGSKAIEGPTSGILAGKTQFVNYARAHTDGIGRAMKIGKEAIFGLLQALNDYEQDALSKEEQLEVLSELKQLNSLPGVEVSIIQDEAGRNIYRGRITIHEQESQLSALELIDELQTGEVAIFTRDYNANIGYFDIDPRPLLRGDMELILEKISAVLGG